MMGVEGGHECQEEGLQEIPSCRSCSKRHCGSGRAAQSKSFADYWDITTSRVFGISQLEFPLSGKFLIFQSPTFIHLFMEQKLRA
jgi:hypothetical protein